ncbi:MAG: type II secretion system protein [Campylobacter sp.]|uniref:type IV pilin protein n=1 Tax=Campylobacter sp. TaxID=205 RepID=UPI002A841A63|nr:type II secretion system protein [Campylobacter sp.]MDY5114708.1 type II secretion system protein [Campylobacter sp.]
MKKGFTMIELIFVIVILGILASVAIPRLAATIEDAEISAAVANIRTLISDASAYYVVKGSFAGAKWNEITNVPVKPKDANGLVATTDGQLKVGDVEDCIAFRIGGKNTGATTGNNVDKQTHIVIAKKSGATGVCKQVLDSEPLKAYFNSTVADVTVLNNPGSRGVVALGSSISIYD